MVCGVQFPYYQDCADEVVYFPNLVDEVVHTPPLIVVNLLYEPYLHASHANEES